MNISKIGPWIIAPLILLLTVVGFYSDIVFNDKVLEQADIHKSKGWSKEILDYEKSMGHSPRWTNSMFSGMPSAQIKNNRETPIKYVFDGVLAWKSPSSVTATAYASMIAAYILLMILKVDWRIGILGSIGYGLSSYMLDIAWAGHGLKQAALIYSPTIIAGALLVFKKKYFWGASLFCISLVLQLFSFHPQITYYTFFILGVISISYLIKFTKEKDVKHILIAGATLISCTIISIGNTAFYFLPSMDYVEDSTRGGETNFTNNSDEIWGWDYGLAESFCLLIPNFNGGGAEQKQENISFYKENIGNYMNYFGRQKMSHGDVIRSSNKAINANFYWGGQGFIGVAIYLSIVLFFGFILALFTTDKTSKIWLLGALFMTLFIAWGDNTFVAKFLYNYFPFYKKFRAVSMSLGLAQLILSIGFGMGITQLIKNNVSKRQFLQASITVISILFIGFIVGKCVDMSGNIRDPKIASQILDSRSEIMNKGMFRSFLYLILSISICYTTLLKQKYLSLGIAGLVLLGIVDIWSFNKNIIYSDKYLTKSEVEIKKYEYDDKILLDRSHYRVLDNFRGNPFGNSDASYFHKSVGGYHPAKLKVYQDIIEKFGFSELVLNLTNCKYVVQKNKENKPILTTNPNALGNAWFVNNVIKQDPNTILEKIGQINHETTAIIPNSSKITASNFSTSGSIKLVEYKPDELIYEYSTPKDAFAVFSEVYYPPSKGWNTYINDELITEGFEKTNYFLRGMALPKGDKVSLRMKFEPKSYALGIKISWISFFILCLIVLFPIFRKLFSKQFERTKDVQ